MAAEVDFNWQFVQCCSISYAGTFLRSRWSKIRVILVCYVEPLCLINLINFGSTDVFRMTWR